MIIPLRTGESDVTHSVLDLAERRELRHVSVEGMPERIRRSARSLNPRAVATRLEVLEDGLSDIRSAVATMEYEILWIRSAAFSL